MREQPVASGTMAGPQTVERPAVHSTEGTAMEMGRRTDPELSEGARAALGEAVRRFDPLDRAILEARLGLHGRRRQALPDIAASFGILATKVRLVEGELTSRLRSGDAALMREYVDFLVDADGGEAAENEVRGIRPGQDRPGRGAEPRRAASADPGQRERRGGAARPERPSKAALAPILPLLTRTQVLISDELYGLVSGEATPPATVAERLGVAPAEVRATDRLVRGLLTQPGWTSATSGSGVRDTGGASGGVSEPNLEDPMDRAAR